MPDDIWLLGLALGLAIDAGLLLGLVLSGAPVRLPADLPRLATIGVSVAALGLFGLPVLVGIVRGVWAAVWAWKTRPWAQPYATREEQHEEAPEPVWADDTEPDPAPDLDLRWLAACHRFLVGAERYGWQIRRLVGLEIVEWDGWTEITNVLRDAGVIVKNSRTGWAEGWSMEAWQQKKHSLVLPYPKDTEPPTVKVITTTTATTANNRRAEVVEGLRVD